MTTHTTKIKALARVLLEADCWMIAGDIQDAAGLEATPRNHIVAMIANMRARGYVKGKKAALVLPFAQLRSDPGEMAFRKVDAMLPQFEEWLNGDQFAIPKADSAAKDRARAGSSKHLRQNAAFADFGRNPIEVNADDRPTNVVPIKGQKLRSQATQNDDGSITIQIWPAA